MQPLAAIVVGLVATGVILAVVWPVNAGNAASPGSHCLSNLKQQSLGFLLYASDEDDRLPDRDHWVDALLPYTKNSDLFHCPGLPKGQYGYAFNGPLGRMKTEKIKSPEMVPLVYDSVNPIRNASDPFTSVPNPPRSHGGARRNNVAYADGHAKGIRQEPQQSVKRVLK